MGCLLLIKPWPFGANCYRSYCSAFWIVTRDSHLDSQKSDLQLTGFLLFIVVKVLVSWAGCCRLWVKYFYIWSGPFIYSVSQLCGAVAPGSAWERVRLTLRTWSCQESAPALPQTQSSLPGDRVRSPLVSTRIHRGSEQQQRWTPNDN